MMASACVFIEFFFDLPYDFACRDMGPCLQCLAVNAVKCTGFMRNQVNPQ